MPNYCDYEMKVKGKRENVEEFVKVIKTDYKYDDVGNCKCEAGRHLWRIFEANSDILVSLCSYSAVIITIVPLIILYLFTQKFFVQSVERSGLVG